MNHSEKQLQNIVEGALLASSESLKIEHFQALFDEEDMPERDDIDTALQDLIKGCEDRGYELVEVASGWRFQVRQELAPWINRLWEEKPQRYSRALLETLSLIAYRQPLTRGDIEDVRGVAVSSHIIKTLSEREWVKVVGHRDVPGRPALYATTRHFLDYFNMKSLDELPSLGELKDIDSLNKNLEFEEALATVSETAVSPVQEEGEVLSTDDPIVDEMNEDEISTTADAENTPPDSNAEEITQSSTHVSVEDQTEANAQGGCEQEVEHNQEAARESDEDKIPENDVEPERNP